MYLLFFIFGSRIETNLSFPKRGFKKFKSHPEIQEFFLHLHNWSKIFYITLNRHHEKTVIYFHWNWADLNSCMHDIFYIWDLWYNVIAVEYPGYGQSTWFPNVESLSEMNKRLYKYIISHWFKPQNLIVWWFSIWSAIAADFVHHHQVSSLVLQSPFTSRYDMSTFRYGFPIQYLLLLKNSFNTLEVIKHISIPTLVIHGKQDETVPFWMWKSVFESSAAQKKEFIALAQCRHNGIIKYAWEEIKDQVKEFLG